MSQVSGFDPLFDAILRHAANREIATESIWIPKENPADSIVARLVRKFKKAPTFPRPPSPFVSSRHESVGEEVVRKMTDNPKLQVIMSAGENQYGGILSNAPAEIRSRLHICFHQPPSWFRLNWRNRAALSGLGSIICLSSEQQGEFESICDSRVIRTTHGVCGEFFMRGNSQAKECRLLFVGHWLRDFECLYSTMVKVWRKDPSIMLDCVIPYQQRSHPVLLKLAKDERVSWHAEISADELRLLYQNAKLLFLPLIDATANNAIVEALACGLPVVSSDVGGIVEYINTSRGSLHPSGSYRKHAEGILSLLVNPTGLAEASGACSDFTKSNLGWDGIAEKLLADIGDFSKK